MSMRELYKLLMMLTMMVGMVLAACTKEQPQTNEPTPDPDPDPKPVVPAYFTVEVESETTTSCVTKITPDDEEMYYVVYMEEVSYFDGSEVDSDQELYEDDKGYFVGGAQFDGITAKEYMTKYNVLFKGKQRMQWSELMPAEPYVIYIYGITFNEDDTDYELATPVVWKVITPKMAEVRDIPFNINVEVDGAFVTYTINSDVWDGHYTVQLFDNSHDCYVDSPEELTDEYVQTIAKEWVDFYFFYKNSYGYTDEQILEAASLKGEGVVRRELTSYTLYSLVVSALDEVDGVYQVVSRPSYLNFSTEKVVPSDMTIDIEVSNCYVRVCDIAITPSIEGEQYIMLVMPTEHLKANYTDEDIIDAMLGEYNLWTYIFDKPITSHMNTLYPDTEYIIAAFGLEGGVITTPLFKQVFKTEEEGESELAVTDVAWGGPYDIEEAVELDPERFGSYAGCPNSMYYLMWFEIMTDTPTSDIFAYYVDTYTFNAYGEDTIFFDLLIGTVPSVDVQMGLYYDPYYICAAAFDYKGNVTPMWRSEPLTFYPTDMLPAQELIDKLNASPEAKVMCVSAANLR